MKTFFTFVDDGNNELSSFFCNCENIVPAEQVFEFDLVGSAKMPKFFGGDKFAFLELKRACKENKTAGWMVVKSYISISCDGEVQILKLQPIPNWAEL